MRGTRSFLMTATAAVMLVSTPAWAGELLFGAEPLDTDGKGNVTKDARAAAVTSVEASPGNESWMLHMWAKIDNGAQGPIYVEFGRNRDGRRLVAARQEIADYGGDKYLSVDQEVYSDDGFKPGETIEVAFVQNVGGKDVIKAKGDITLAASSAPPPKEEEPEDEPEDELDGPDEEEDTAEPAATPEPTAPPPVESGDKKGCTIGGSPTGPALALAWIVLAAAGRRRRRD